MMFRVIKARIKAHSAKEVGNLQHTEAGFMLPNARVGTTSTHICIWKAVSPEAGLKYCLKINLSFPEAAQMSLPHPQRIISVKVSLVLRK